MNTYTNVFGGENVNPADLSYKAYGTTLAPLSLDLELEWPFEALDGSRVVADKIDIVALPGLSIFMPDATRVSVGEDVLWNNVGSNAVTVFKYDGTVIITLQPGKQWYTYLVDNTTPAGQWHSTQLGAGTSAADAATLAGMGLRARTNLLDQDYLTTQVAGTITLDAASRAKVFRNTVGNVTYNIAAANSLGPPPQPTGNGWFIIAINAGGGSITIDPAAGELIDNATTKVLGPGESCVVYCYGTGFATMGHGRAIATSVTGINIDMPGTGPLTLTPVQVASQVQDYTGILTGNRVITYGDGITGYWFVYNRTTSSGGPWTVSVQGSTTDTPPILIPVDHFTILRSQNGALDIAFTATSGTVTSIATVGTEITGGSPVAITTSGTLGLADMPTGVANLTPGTYPAAPNVGSKVPQLRVDAKGRVAHVEDVAIAITGSQITDIAAILMPGTMVAYGGKNAPVSTAWLPCDGTTRLIADFPALAAVLDNAHGPLTGTTFTLPDTRGRVLANMDGGTNRLRNTYFPGGNSNLLGSAGGVDAEQANLNIPQLFVRNAQWASPNQGFTGTTAGGQTVRVYGNTGPSSNNYSRGDQGSHSPVPNDFHSHWFDSTFGTNAEALSFASYGSHGLTDAANTVGSTTAVTNVQATLIIRHLIKT